MLKYKVIQQEAKLGKYAGQRIQRAQQVLTGNVSFAQFCRVLAKKSALSEGDVRALMFELPDTISEFMELGMSVDCGELGKFRPTFGSLQIPEGEKFRSEYIKTPRITFVPRQKFKEFRHRATFECIHDTENCPIDSLKSTKGKGSNDSNDSDKNKGAKSEDDKDYTGL